MKHITHKSILDSLPHRYPFILIDRIESMDSTSIIGIKNVSLNEEYFHGHFPAFPIMPGVLIIEGMAQCAGVYVAHHIQDSDKKIPLFVGIEKARFHKPVVPGDQLKYHMTLTYSKLNIYKFSGHAYVNDSIVCKADITSSIADKSQLNV